MFVSNALCLMNFTGSFIFIYIIPIVRPDNFACRFHVSINVTVKLYDILGETRTILINGVYWHNYFVLVCGWFSYTTVNIQMYDLQYSSNYIYVIAILYCIIVIKINISLPYQPMRIYVTKYVTLLTIH